MNECKHGDACRWRLAEASVDASDAPNFNMSCMVSVPFSFIIVDADHFREGPGLRGKTFRHKNKNKNEHKNKQKKNQ